VLTAEEVSPDTLTPIVRRALRDETASLGDWRIDRLDYHTPRPGVASVAMEPKDNAQPDCCPAASTIEQHFDRKTAFRIAAGEVPGLISVSPRLRDALLPLAPAGKTILELGCGRGALLLDLIQAGAAHGTGIDLSGAAIDEARRNFRAAGLGATADFSVGDGARVSLTPHDWVILDRVMCCYPDIDRLLRNTIPAATNVYAFTVPESRGWRGVLSRLEEWFENIWNTVRGCPCPGYVHDVTAIARTLESAGFRRRFEGRIRLWHIGVYERAN
jgi:SAM-dependent methyltransferase